MAVMKLGHLVLCGRDIERSRDLYENGKSGRAGSRTGAAGAVL